MAAEPPTSDAAEPTVVSGEPRAGERIGKYRILDRLGEGGFAVVYLAEQIEPVRRRVALKIIKLGMDTKQVIARFEAERQALAVMDHPNVAKVFDAGITPPEAGSRPYFVMELVPGVPITEHCDRQRLNIEDRLKLFMQVCDAVQHAHQKGIIHRDLKPTNILVTVKDGHAPGGGGVPKVIDFGVAKALHQRLTEKTLYTEQGQLIGTPEYMSPEQAEMTAQDIDTRSDIYSLGVLLYELLTGALPFDPTTLRRAAFAEFQRIIREQEPPKPSTRLSTLGDESSTYAQMRRGDPKSLLRDLRGDLDWITMKALEKDRSRRYETANGLAVDLQRHLDHEPVIASPPSAAYKLSKFVRRNRTGVIAGAVVAAALVVATVISIGFALGEAEQREFAVQREKEAISARAEVEKRADELKTVIEFQQSMFGGIDAEKMGRGIITAQREGIREGMESDGIDPEEVETALASFDGLVAKINATDLALKVVDQYVLARAVETIEKDFADQPLVEAALRQTVGDTYRDVGLYPQAMPEMERALALLRRVLGDEHRDTLSSIGNIGSLLASMGKLTEAEPYYREALEGSRRVLGDDHPVTLVSINNMGTLFQRRGKLTEAEPYYREALKGRRRVLGDDHPDTLTSINNLGSLLGAMGKPAEAEPYYREALESRRRVLGDDHPETLSSINNMGFLFLSMGKYAEAEPYRREALGGRRRVLGDDHPDTLSSINNLGSVLQAMGKYAEAEPYFREAMEGYRRVLGDNHPRTLNSVNNMGTLLQAMEKDEEALPYFREALQGRRRVLGDDHPDTLRSIGWMGRQFYEEGKYEEGLPYYREAMEGYRRVLGDNHPRTLLSINNMASVLRDMGRLDEAEALGAEAVRRAREALPEGHWHRGVFLNGYGKTLAQLERYGEGEAALLESHGLLETARGPENEWTIRSNNSLVDLYTAWHEADPDKGYDAKAAQWRAKLPEEEDSKEQDD